MFIRKLLTLLPAVRRPDLVLNDVLHVDVTVIRSRSDTPLRKL